VFRRRLPNYHGSHERDHLSSILLQEGRESIVNPHDFNSPASIRRQDDQKIKFQLNFPRFSFLHTPAEIRNSTGFEKFPRATTKTRRRRKQFRLLKIQDEAERAAESVGCELTTSSSSTWSASTSIASFIDLILRLPILPLILRLFTLSHP
jgi:hypothetical protein